MTQLYVMPDSKLADRLEFLAELCGKVMSTPEARTFAKTHLREAAKRIRNRRYRTHLANGETIPIP